MTLTPVTLPDTCALALRATQLLIEPVTFDTVTGGAVVPLVVEVVRSIVPYIVAVRVGDDEPLDSDVVKVSE